MKRLLKIELKKIINNRLFWISLSIYVLAFFGAILLINGLLQNVNKTVEEGANFNFLPSDIFSFPNVYHYFSFIARNIKLFMGVILIILITNEYTYRTMRQNFIDGLSRRELVLSKLYVAISLSLLAAIIVFILSLIFGFIYTEHFYFWKLTDKLVYIPSYFLMVLGYLSVSSLIAFLVKKSGLSLIALMFYSYILEPIISFKFIDSFGDYLPLNQFNKLVPIPAEKFMKMVNQESVIEQSQQSVILFSIFYTVLFFFLSYLYIKKKDL